QNPGFLKAVWENELGGRYMNTLENHNEPFWFYWNNFIDNRYIPWIYLLPASMIISLFNNSKRIRDFAAYLSLCTIIFFLTISLGKTKLFWYDAPMYPMMALIIGIGIATLYENLIAAVNVRIHFRENIIFP